MTRFWQESQGHDKDLPICRSTAPLIPRIGYLQFTLWNLPITHADQQTTLFELMFGNSPLTIPYTFKNTKFPNLKDKMKTLQKN